MSSDGVSMFGQLPPSKVASIFVPDIRVIDMTAEHVIPKFVVVFTHTMFEYGLWCGSAITFQAPHWK